MLGLCNKICWAQKVYFKLYFWSWYKLCLGMKLDNNSFDLFTFLLDTYLKNQHYL